MISHRSALEGSLSPAGKFHISLEQKVAPVRQVPGLEIRIWQGPQAQTDDVRTAAHDVLETYRKFAHRLIELNSRMPLASFDGAYAYYKKTGALPKKVTSRTCIRSGGTLTA